MNSKPTADVVRGRTHPQFEGPIGPPRAGLQASMSFVGTDGKRHWHSSAMQHLPEPQLKSLLGQK